MKMILLFVVLVWERECGAINDTVIKSLLPALSTPKPPTWPAPPLLPKGLHNTNPPVPPPYKSPLENHALLYKTEDGVLVQEQSSFRQLHSNEKVRIVNGAFSWIAPGGQKITVTYIADENGYYAKTIVSR